MMKYRKSFFRQFPITLLTLIFLLSLIGCETIYRSGFVSVPRQAISDSITISSEWIEIVPPSSLKPYGNFQYVDLECDGYKKFDWKNNDDESILEFADGSTTKIEAFLFDDKGQSYELKVNQTSDGPELTRKGKIKWSGEPNFSEADYSEIKFPADSLFTKLKIRSQIPIKCNRIQWVGLNQK